MSALNALSAVRPYALRNDFSLWRCYALFFAIIVYAWDSSPTPDHLGVAEIATGALMMIAIGWAGAGQALLFPFQGAFWQLAGWMLLIYGFSIPLIGGVAAGHDIGLIIRDLIPFLYLLLPLFVTPLLMKRPSFIVPLTAAVAAAGIIFALRLIVPSFMEHGRVGFSALPNEDPLYLANAPTVLFTGILCMALAARQMMKAGLSSIGGVGLFAFPALACFLAMAAAMQRATIGLAAMGLAFLWSVAFVRNPLRALIPLALVCMGLLILYEPVEGLMRQLVLKMSRVGFNNRVEEASLVFSMLQDSSWTVLFGCGWGQTVSSPAVGDVTVNYTHTMFTAFWLKSGLIGLALTGAYLGGLAACLWRMVWRYPVMAAALAVPCLIDVTLYASYKSLDFGLVLMLIPLWTGQQELLRRTASVG